MVSVGVKKHGNVPSVRIDAIAMKAYLITDIGKIAFSLLCLKNKLKNFNFKN